MVTFSGETTLSKIVIDFLLKKIDIYTLKENTTFPRKINCSHDLEQTFSEGAWFAGKQTGSQKLFPLYKLPEGLPVYTSS